MLRNSYTLRRMIIKRTREAVEDAAGDVAAAAQAVTVTQVIVATVAVVALLVATVALLRASR